MLSYSQRARMVLKTCAALGEKRKENKRKGKLFKVKISFKMLPKNVRRKNTEQSPAYKGKFLIIYN
jgi:hypothetical protein